MLALSDIQLSFPINSLGSRIRTMPLTAVFYTFSELRSQARHQMGSIHVKGPSRSAGSYSLSPLQVLSIPEQALRSLANLDTLEGMQYDLIRDESHARHKLRRVEHCQTVDEKMDKLSTSILT